MSATETKIAHFSVDGEGLTEVARNMMLSERPGQAWRLLAQGLIGEESDKAARAVLDGKMKLVGVDNLETAPDNARSYIKDLKYIYAGRVRITGSWWRPCAEVVRFGPEDMAFASRNPEVVEETEQILDDHAAGRDVYAGGAGARLADIGARRVAYYAGAGERVVEVTIASKNKRFKSKTRYVIFETCGEPPFWWPENDSPTAALEQAVAAGRRLDERGAPVIGRSRRTNEAPVGELVAEAFADAMNQGAREREEDARHAEEDRKWRKLIAGVRQRVLKQATGDMMELRHDDKLVATVPRVPFERWALNRTKLRHLAPSWETESPSGLKMQLDDRDHSDWFFGATIVDPDASHVEIDADTGGPLKYPYHHDSPLEKAAYEAMFEVQRNVGKFECTVIVDGAAVTGIVDKDILVIPNLHPDFLPRLAAMRGYLPKFVPARAIITEAGGKMAHLAVVSTERGIPIMLMPGACEKLRVGDTVTMTPSEGRIRVHGDYDDTIDT